VSSGSVTEDSVLTTSGQLTITDVDSPASFQAVSSGAGAYGTFSVDASGLWSYTLSNSLPAVQGLNASQTLSDAFTFRSADNTAALVTVTINGTNEPPAVVYDGSFSAGGTPADYGWTATGGVTIANGEMLLTTGGGAIAIDPLETFVDKELSVGKNTSGSAVKRSIEVKSAGADPEISFDWHFATKETGGNPDDDYAFYVMNDAGVVEVTSVVLPKVAGTSGTVNIDVTTPGKYTLILGVVDYVQNGGTSNFYIDNFKVNGDYLLA
jgi:VCBS repeat-containing protein